VSLNNNYEFWDLFLLRIQLSCRGLPVRLPERHSVLRLHIVAYSEEALTDAYDPVSKGTAVELSEFS
jgi:hypothetical protein